MQDNSALAGENALFAAVRAHLAEENWG